MEEEEGSGEEMWQEGEEEEEEGDKEGPVADWRDDGIVLPPARRLFTKLIKLTPLI